MKVFEIGCIPPPFGGVAIHLQRLLPHLERHGVPHLLFDITGATKQAENVVCTNWRNTALRLWRLPRAVVHFHNFTPRNLPIYAWLARKHITVLTMHNERFADGLTRLPFPARQLARWMLNRLDLIILTHESCAPALAPWVNDPDRVAVCPAFIAPLTTPADTLPPPPQISALRRKHQYLITSNAFRLEFFRGADLYGIDLLVELLGYLINEDKLDVALVVLLPAAGDEQYLARLRARVTELRIEQSFLFFTDPVVAAPTVWQISDLVIRATNTDGNSLTIKEALWCGTPVLASDCVPRDPAAVLFKSRDLTDLHEQALAILRNLDVHRARAKQHPQIDYAEPLINLYQQLIARG